MNHQDLINTCVFEQFQVLFFSDLSGPLSVGVCIFLVRKLVEQTTFLIDNI